MSTNDILISAKLTLQFLLIFCYMTVVAVVIICCVVIDTNVVPFYVILILFVAVVSLFYFILFHVMMFPNSTVEICVAYFLISSHIILTWLFFPTEHLSMFFNATTRAILITGVY